MWFERSLIGAAVEAAPAHGPPCGKSKVFPFVKIWKASTTRTWIYLQVFLIFSAHQLLFAALPSALASTWGQPSLAALFNGLLLTFVVVGQLTATSLESRFGSRAAVGIGCALVAASSLSLVSGLGDVADVSSVLRVGISQALRGCGVGLVTVIGATVAVGLAPAEERGRAVARFALSTAIPGVLGIPAGIELSRSFGITNTAAIVGSLGGLALLSVARSPKPRHSPKEGGRAEWNSHLRGPIVRHYSRPGLFFLFVCGAFYTVVPLMPIVLSSNGARVHASVVLLVLLGSQTGGRVLSGSWASRGGTPGLAKPCVFALVGLGTMIWFGDAMSLLAGCIVLGASVGVLFTGTFLLMLSDAGASVYEVSTIWNVAIDLGGAAGNLIVGALSFVVGAHWSIMACPFLLFMALMLLRKEETPYACDS